MHRTYHRTGLLARQTEHQLPDAENVLELELLEAFGEINLQCIHDTRAQELQAALRVCGCVYVHACMRERECDAQ
jgi:hypothetical protein